MYYYRGGCMAVNEKFTTITDKKEIEQNCLNIAIEQCLAQKGESKKIGILLSGSDVPRETKERPDFVRLSESHKKGIRGTVIGIEHFRVDLFSKPKKGNKVQSLGIMHQKDIASFYEKWHQTIQTTDHVSKEVIQDLCNIWMKHYRQTEKANFQSLMLSFRHVLAEHTKSIPVYDANIRKIASKYNCEHKLAFLIEIHSDFPNLFFHDHNKVRLYNNPIVLMFEQIVSLLEAVDKRVDYFILCFGNLHYTNVKVIPLRAHNIRRELKKRHIPIYHYCGHDVFLHQSESFVENFDLKIDHEEENGEIKLHIKPSYETVSPEEEIKYIWTALRDAILHSDKGEPFVLNTMVQEQLEVYAPYIIGWTKSKEDNWSYEPIFDNSIHSLDKAQRQDSFFRKWKLDQHINNEYVLKNE